MNKRLISSIILMVLLIGVMILNNQIVDSLMIVVLSAMGIYEYNKAFKSIGINTLPFVGYISCGAIFFIGGFFSDTDKIFLLKIAIPTVLIIAFMYIILRDLKGNIIDIAVTVLSVIYIPIMFSFMKMILMMENGRVLIWYVFMGAFASDTCAYAIGTRIGKHKLCPNISPKKTIEGSIGGIIGVIITYIIITYIGNTYFSLDFNMLSMIIAGIVSGIAGQFGDLSASAIKRYCKVKDFSELMPGHGGILDRFDSILFVAPVIYIFIKVYMLI